MTDKGDRMLQVKTMTDRDFMWMQYQRWTQQAESDWNDSLTGFSKAERKESAELYVTDQMIADAYWKGYVQS